MISIKLPIQKKIDILDLQRVYSSAVKYSYNRFKNELSFQKIRYLLKDKFNLTSLLRDCAIQDGQAIYKRNKNKKVIFGGKYNLNQYLKRNITKKQYKTNKLLPLKIRGDRNRFGNRLFNLNIINDNKVTFKLNRTTHISIDLPKLKPNIKQQLYQLEERANNKEIPYMVTLTMDYISFSFEEKQVEKKVKLFKNRVLGIDLNPNYIGYAILEFNKNDSFKVLFKETIDLTELNKKSGFNISHKKSIYLNNKKKYETIEVTKYIINKATHYKCNKIVVENLKFKQNNNQKGKNFNRLTNNKWHRLLFIKNLTKRCFVNHINLVTVNPAYSSFVGNVNYGDNQTPDMVAASIEIGRRGYKKYNKNWFYPLMNTDNLTKLWKQELNWSSYTWKELFILFNKSKPKVRYRFHLVNCQLSSFRLFNNNSYLKRYFNLDFYTLNKKIEQWI